MFLPSIAVFFLSSHFTQENTWHTLKSSLDSQSAALLLPASPTNKGCIISVVLCCSIFCLPLRRSIAKILVLTGKKKLDPPAVKMEQGCGKKVVVL